jgi:hypothetical protein
MAAAWEPERQSSVVTDIVRATDNGRGFWRFYVQFLRHRGWLVPRLPGPTPMKGFPE